MKGMVNNTQKYVLCSEKAGAGVLASLETAGYTPVVLPSYRKLPEPVSSHPDMLIYRLRSGALLTYKSYYEANRSLFGRLNCEIITEDIPPEKIYPHDISLNALRLGNTVYGRTDALSPYILRDADHTVFVRQGYARCSVCVVDRGAIITADRSIASAVGASGAEVTFIESGSILLEGYGCGFIGGASGLFEGGVAFTGDPMTHPSGKKITAAIGSRGMSILNLGEGILRDCGGLLFI